MHTSRVRAGLVAAIGLLLVSAVPALAAAPQFSTGVQISSDNPYDNAQPISDIYATTAIYGKLQGDTPVDIYSFTPDKDGTQTIDLMERQQTAPGTTYVDPVLILVDPTSETQAAEINLPTPSDDYHFALLTQISARSYTEPVLLQKYSVLQEQTLNLQKGTKYYFVVVPAASSGPVDPYVIKLGTSTTWGVSDFFKHFGSWFRLETGDYAGSSPFVFNLGVLGLILMLLGLIAMVGTLILQETYALLANKAKSAGYLLIKMQPYSRVVIWVSLWLVAIGAYVLFGRYGWVGIPFVLTLIFVPILVNMLYLSFNLSRKVGALEVSKKEATIPFALRKRWFFSSLVSLFSFGAFITYLAIYLIGK
jgi:hypothetical protein